MKLIINFYTTLKVCRIWPTKRIPIILFFLKKEDYWEEPICRCNSVKRTIILRTTFVVEKYMLTSSKIYKKNETIQ